MSAENVRKNPVRRAVAKSALNTLWGKFCQSNQTDYVTQINSAAEYNELITHPHINQEKLKFRYIKNQVSKAYSLYFPVNCDTPFTTPETLEVVVSIWGVVYSSLSVNSFLAKGSNFFLLGACIRSLK